MSATKKATASSESVSVSIDAKELRWGRGNVGQGGADRGNFQDTRGSWAGVPSAHSDEYFCGTGRAEGRKR